MLVDLQEQLSMVKRAETKLWTLSMNSVQNTLSNVPDIDGTSGSWVLAMLSEIAEISGWPDHFTTWCN